MEEVLCLQPPVGLCTTPSLDVTELDDAWWPAWTPFPASSVGLLLALIRAAELLQIQVQSDQLSSFRPFGHETVCRITSKRSTNY
jgi:hypothetical protein